jgi:GTPase Era involved in 16S rRNA processing
MIGGYEDKHSQIGECSVGGSTRKSPSKSPGRMKSPSNVKKKFKRQATPEIADAIQHLDRIAQSVAEEKPYEQFGKYVAAELRQLPQHQAIILLQEIQNAITLAKLSFLETMHSHHTETVIVDISPSTSSASSNAPSTPIINDDSDILHQAIINL